MVKKTAKRRITGKRTKPGVTVKIKKDAKVLKRMAELGVNPIAVFDEFLELFFEVQRKYPRPGEMAIMYDAAVVAFNKSVFESDKPEMWLAAARRAANLS